MSSGRIIAIVPARTGSARLASKVLMSVGDQPLLARVIERLQRMRTLDDIVVATSVARADDAIAQLCNLEGWHCYRGPEHDVLERTLRAAQAMGASDVLSVAADQPLFSWQQADRLVAQHVASGADLSHNLGSGGSGLPEGCGVEILTLDALGMAWTYGLEPREREQVTEYIHGHSGRFRIEMQRAPSELDRPAYRLAVDTLADLRLVRCIYDQIAPPDDVVDLREAIALLDTAPQLATSNIAPQRKAG